MCTEHSITISVSKFHPEHLEGTEEPLDLLRIINSMFCTTWKSRMNFTFFYRLPQKINATDELITQNLSKSITATMRGLHYNFALRRHFFVKKSLHHVGTVKCYCPF